MNFAQSGQQQVTEKLLPSSMELKVECVITHHSFQNSCDLS